MTDPNGYPILTNNHPNTSPAWAGNHYRYREDDSGGTHRLYARVSNSLLSTDPFPTSTSNGHDIKVNKSTNVWSDFGTDWPGTVTDGTNVTLYEGSTFLFQFAKPATSAYPSSGGGTSTEGVGWTASFYDVANHLFSYRVTHTSGFVSPQTYELHSTTLTPTFISDLVVGAASGSTNSRTHTWGTPDVIQIRDAYGTIAAELTLIPTSRKKVHCNFW